MIIAQALNIELSTPDCSSQSSLAEVIHAHPHPHTELPGPAHLFLFPLVLPAFEFLHVLFLVLFFMISLFSSM